MGKRVDDVMVHRSNAEPPDEFQQITSKPHPILKSSNMRSLVQLPPPSTGGPVDESSPASSRCHIRFHDCVTSWMLITATFGSSSGQGYTDIAITFNQ